MGFEIDLYGFYYQTTFGNVATSCKLFIFDGGLIHGSGNDTVGPYSVSGTLFGNNISFVKNYTNRPLIRWDYDGTREFTADKKTFQFSGSWGSTPHAFKGGKWYLCGIAPGYTPKPYEGTWDGIFFSGANNTPDQTLNTTWNIYPYYPGADYDLNGANTISGDGSDANGPFKLSGTITNDGAFNIIKSYPSVSWRYDGRFDGHFTVAGIWRSQNSGNPSDELAMGGFSLIKQQT